MLNSNRTFLALKPETVWTDDGAAVAAATVKTLDATGAMAGLVQPGPGERLLRITIVDANVSINAFQIDAVGTDRDGNAVTEQFLFAGGLIQTGTKRFAAITSITVTSETGGAVADTLNAAWIAPTDFIPVLDGDYSVGLDDPLREQQHVVGDADAQFIVQDVRNLGGDVKVGVWPHLSRRVFDLGAKRTSSQMEPQTGRYTYPGVETRIHKGLEAERIQVAGQNAGDISVTIGLVGAWEETEGENSYPSTNIIPSIPSLTFKNCRFVISLDAGTSFANRIVPVGLESFEVSLANSLKRGPSDEDRINVYKDGKIQFLDAGRRKVDLRYTAAFDRLAYSTLQRSRLRTQFKMMGAHPSWTSYLTVANAPAVAGTAVVVEVDADPAGLTIPFAVGDYVMFDNAGGSNKPCVGRITAIDSVGAGGYHVTIDTLDENVAVGDHVFNAAVELKTAPCLVSSSTPDKPFDDYVKVTVNAQAFSGGADPFAYKARNMTLLSGMYVA